MKKPRAPKLVTVAITTTITIVFWVFFTLYQILTKSPPPSVDPKLLEPISPTLETEVLGTLTKRVYFEEGEATFPLPARSGGVTTTQPEVNQTVIEESQEEATPEAELEQ